MTPKEKAQELYNIYFNYLISITFNDCEHLIIKAAIICVDEITKANPTKVSNDGDELIIESKANYWQQVKEELQKM